MHRSSIDSVDLRELEARIALMNAKGVGAVRTGRLMAIFGSATAVFEASDAEIGDAARMPNAVAGTLRESIRHPDVKRDLATALAKGFGLLTPSDPAYPKLLGSIFSPPSLLWYVSTADVNFVDTVAVVGTRRPSTNGKSCAYDLAYGLAVAGRTVVSGLAYGIDSIAHRAALDAGGQTIAVLGSGFEHVYPLRNRRLAADIVASGCLLSEFPLDAAPCAGHFPRRNRIICGLSMSTVVVEAYEEGGALLTAKLALDQGRDVYAMPGVVGNPAAAGTNRIIQRGEAELLMGAADLLRRSQFDLGGDPVSEQDAEFSAGGSATNRRLIGLLAEPLHIDDLSDRLQLPTSELLIELLRLECAGRVRQLPGKYFCVLPAGSGKKRASLDR